MITEFAKFDIKKFKDLDGLNLKTLMLVIMY